MTDLQISLIGIGIAIVIGVIAYNKWQEYRAKKHVERAFSDPVEDVLMGSAQTENRMERKEPVLDGTIQTEKAVLSTENEPTLSQVGGEDMAREQVIVPKVPEMPVDDLIELPVTLVMEESLRTEKILPHLQSLRYTGNKPVRFLGLPDGEDGEWQAIVPGQSYRQIRACVLLANRNGALNEIEYSELLMRLRQIADAIGAEPEVPELSLIHI